MMSSGPSLMVPRTFRFPEKSWNSTLSATMDAVTGFRGDSLDLFMSCCFSTLLRVVILTMSPGFMRFFRYHKSSSESTCTVIHSESFFSVILIFLSPPCHQLWTGSHSLLMHSESPPSRSFRSECKCKPCSATS